MGFGPLRVFDWPSARSLGVVEAQEATNINRLARRIENVRGSLGTDAQPVVGASQLGIDDTNGQGAVKAYDIADIDRRIDARFGGKSPALEGLSEVF